MSHAKLGVLAVAVALTWLCVGGCPPPGDVVDDDQISGGNSSAGDSTGGAGSDTIEGSGSSGGTSGGSGAGTGSGDSGSGTGSDDGSGTDDGPGTDDGSTSDDQTGDDGSTTGDDGGGDPGTGGDDGGAGDPGGGSGDDPPVASQTYGASLDCATTFWDSLTRVTENDTEVISVSVAFDAAGSPASFIVPGYSAGGLEASYGLTAAVSDVDDRVTLTHTAGGYEATLIVTVTEATHDASGGRLVFALDHAGVGQGGARQESGGGTHVVEYQIVGGTVTYSSNTDYRVRWQYPAIGADTTMEFQCDGTLLPE